MRSGASAAAVSGETEIIMELSEKVFDSYAPFIREYIYSRGWNELHEIQLIASHVIFSSSDNLLLLSGTASGKTEAAFFPALSEICRVEKSGARILYIAPLKSLINDQFARIDELTDSAGIAVTHWHGDVAASNKNRFLQSPSGVLQITPESLESMLMNRANDIARIFAGLDFVIIDEIHTLTGTDRGNQIICQLVRLARMIGHSPRRIGLSATVGNAGSAAAWLGAGSGRNTYVPDLPKARLKWRLGMEHFYIMNGDITELPSAEARRQSEEGNSLDAGHEFVYDCTKNKKTIVFSNSREETEYITASLRMIAQRRGEEDVFLIHHGNLSAALREDAELKLKKDDELCTVCATVTMELGIDIGRLERVIQLGAPCSVSAFLQRLGRSGRRDAPPEMMMVFREEDPLPNTPLPQLIPWELLRAIAIVQLYIEERYIEPPLIRRRPYSLLFQQILSVLASSGALRPAELSERVLSLPPFRYLTREDMLSQLQFMLQNGFLDMTDEGELLVGTAGEKLTGSFKFYAVFKDSEDYTVRCESEEIGTITSAPPIGDRFALAGRVWEVTELDIPRKLIYVKGVKGKMQIEWPGDFGEIATRILERMRQVLREDTEYPYLKESALKRLRLARAVARNTHLDRQSMICLGGSSYAFFPWLGTRSFRTMRKYLAKNAYPFKLSELEFEGCYYMTFRLEGGSGDELLKQLADRACRIGVDCDELVGENEAPIFEKYDRFVPSELLRAQYRDDKLRGDEIPIRLKELAAEAEFDI